MDERPSAPLLRMLREAADQRGMNTAALAKAAGVGRSELKLVLAGQSPLTVDLFITLSEALSLGPSEFTDLANKEPQEPAPSPLQAVGHKDSAPLPDVDPLGNHADQALRLGFKLGCDMVFMLRVSELTDSGIPDSVRDQFSDHLPIRLDAAFHKHNDPRFLPDALIIQLSFDAVYECTIPWPAFVQVTILPLTPPSEQPTPT